MYNFIIDSKAGSLQKKQPTQAVTPTTDYFSTTKPTSNSVGGAGKLKSSSDTSNPERNIIPKRLALSYDVPTIIIEYLMPMTGKLYHHKIKIRELRSDSDLEKCFRQVKKRHETYLTKIPDSQIMKMLEILSLRCEPTTTREDQQQKGQTNKQLTKQPTKVTTGTNSKYAVNEDYDYEFEDFSEIGASSGVGGVGYGYDEEEDDDEKYKFDGSNNFSRISGQQESQQPKLSAQANSNFTKSKKSNKEEDEEDSQDFGESGFEEKNSGKKQVPKENESSTIKAKVALVDKHYEGEDNDDDEDDGNRNENDGGDFDLDNEAMYMNEFMPADISPNKSDKKRISRRFEEDDEEDSYFTGNKQKANVAQDEDDEGEGEEEEEEEGDKQDIIQNHLGQAHDDDQEDGQEQAEDYDPNEEEEDENDDEEEEGDEYEQEADENGEYEDEEEQSDSVPQQKGVENDRLTRIQNALQGFQAKKNNFMMGGQDEAFDLDEDDGDFMLNIAGKKNDGSSSAAAAGLSSGKKSQPQENNELDEDDDDDDEEDIYAKVKRQLQQIQQKDTGSASANVKSATKDVAVDKKKMLFELEKQARGHAYPNEVDDDGEGEEEFDVDDDEEADDNDGVDGLDENEDEEEYQGKHRMGEAAEEFGDDDEFAEGGEEYEGSQGEYEEEGDEDQIDDYDLDLDDQEVQSHSKQQKPNAKESYVENDFGDLSLSQDKQFEDSTNNIDYDFV